MSLPLVDLPAWGIVIANVGAWTVFHAATGYAVHRWPAGRLAADGPLLRIRAWERGGEAYRKVRIHAWKDRMPEAGGVFRGGISKRNLPGRSPADLRAFAVETRRAERGHWLAMACGPLAVVWNPPVAAVAMIGYGVLVNAPFIMIQRYNRARVGRVLERSRTSAADDSRSAGRRTIGRSMP